MGENEGARGPQGTLLAADEPSAVAVLRSDGTSPFLLTCDHAGRRIPRSLGSLGLEAPDLERHIAWDIGAATVARSLSERLDAALVLQTYSRLVIDCNRSPEVHDSIATLSESTEIPGNKGISDAARQARVNEIFCPYHERITAALDARADAKRPSALVAVHSFTPVFKGVKRPWHIGILYNRDRRLPGVLFDLLSEHDHLVVGDNQPYAVSDVTDYTIPVHGERRGIPHVEIEIRQDLIAEPTGQEIWAERLADLLPRALERLDA